MKSPVRISILLALLTALGLVLSAQRTGSTSSTFAQPLVAGASSADLAAVRALGESGNVVGGPCLIEEGVAVVGRQLASFSNNIPANNLALTVTNLGTNDVQITGSNSALVILTVPPGSSMMKTFASNEFTVANALRWSCTGAAKFGWSVRLL